MNPLDWYISGSPLVSALLPPARRPGRPCRGLTSEPDAKVGDSSATRGVLLQVVRGLQAGGPENDSRRRFSMVKRDLPASKSAYAPLHFDRRMASCLSLKGCHLEGELPSDPLQRIGDARAAPPIGRHGGRACAGAHLAGRSL